MKKLIIAISLLTITACTKSSTSSSPSGTGTGTSTCSVTFQGTTYNLTTVLATTTEANTVGAVNGWECYLSSSSSTSLTILFTGFNYNIVNGLGTYKISGKTNGVNFSSGQFTLVNHNAGNATFLADATDTISTATVTISNSTECKGTFSVSLNDGTGHYYPATGSFDYKH